MFFLGAAICMHVKFLGLVPAKACYQSHGLSIKWCNQEFVLLLLAVVVAFPRKLAYILSCLISGATEFPSLLFTGIPYMCTHIYKSNENFIYCFCICECTCRVYQWTIAMGIQLLLKLNMIKYMPTFLGMPQQLLVVTEQALDQIELWHSHRT